MRVLLFSLLMIPLATGCGGDDAKDDTAASTDSGSSGSGTQGGTDTDGDTDEGGTTEGGTTEGGTGTEGGTDTEGGSDTEGDTADTGAPDTGSSDPTTEGPGTGSGGAGTDAPPGDIPPLSTGERWSCRVFEGGASGTGSDPVYVPNRDNLCTITSEVNWKIFQGLIPGGDTAVDLRDCIATALESVASGGPDDEKCVDADGFTRNDTCWAALVAAEVECGGPAIEVFTDSSDGAEPIEPHEDVGTASGKSEDGEGGGSGLLFIKNDSEPIGHTVTAESSPDPGPEGEWKIRDSIEGCENVLLTIEMEREPSEGGESEGGESEGGESEGGESASDDEIVVVTPEPIDEGAGDKFCISSCTAPTEYEWCCEEYNTNKWCHKGFRKLKPRPSPPDGDEDAEAPEVGGVDTPSGG